MKFKGLAYPRAMRPDAVSFTIGGGQCGIEAFDGAQDCKTSASLSLPTARKLANAILKAVDTAEGK